MGLVEREVEEVRSSVGERVWQRPICDLAAGRADGSR